MWAGMTGYAPTAGNLSIACAATGLSLTLSFKDNCAIAGQVVKQLGKRHAAIAHISGRWTEQILVQSAARQGPDLPLQGVAASSNESAAKIANLPLPCLTLATSTNQALL